MAGKSKQEKKKRAKMQKRLSNEERQLVNKAKKKVVVDQPEDVLADKKLEIDTVPESKPFDPKSVVANILKKHGV